MRARVELAVALSVAWSLGAGCADEPSHGRAAAGGSATSGAAGSSGAGSGAGKGGGGAAGSANDGGAGEGGTAGTNGDAGDAGSTSGGGGATSGGEAGEGGRSDAAGAGGNDDVVNPPYVWRLPKGFPTPVVPADNPMSEAKVELGRHLFYDKRLSGNGTQACASCHRQELAFSDGGTVPNGSTGEPHPRNSMALSNVAYAATLAWANPLLFTLESQALVPMFGTAPVELGLNGREAELLERLRAVPRYQELFAAAHPARTDPFTLANVVGALASFQRTLLSGSSPYDRYTYHGDENALSDAAKRGRVLFNSEKLECFHCHSGHDFRDSVNFVGRAFLETPFHNTALYNLDGNGAYPEPNTGVFEVTRLARDMGRFRAPSLRNVAVTAPYMHDGSIRTLEQVLDHYAAGGRTIAGGAHAGVGSASPLKSPFMIGFSLTPEERAAVLAFLESLTDQAFLTDPRFADPWPP